MKTTSIIKAEAGWSIITPRIHRGFVFYVNSEPVIAWQITETGKKVNSLPITINGVQPVDRVFQKPDKSFYIPGERDFADVNAVIAFFNELNK